MFSLFIEKTINELIGKINIELGKINSPFVENKTKFMVFHQSSKTAPTVFPPINFNNASINKVCFFKFSGVVSDINLKFKEHVLNLTKKISKVVPLIYRIRNDIN